MIKYYSVKKGMKSWVYITWKECEDNIKGYATKQHQT